MRLSQTQIERIAAESSFRAEPLEKVMWLLELLEALRSHPFLEDRLILKGGTALNLFVLELPRLSVDIDLNYIGAVDRETMLAERPKVEQAVQAVCAREGMRIKRMPGEHAGGKWRLAHTRASGGSGALELDLNFLVRVPLWPPVMQDSLPVGSVVARRIPIVDLHELAAGKLSALFSRSASRDLFDVRGLLLQGGFDRRRLRSAFVLYGGMSRRDWRTVSIDEVRMDPVDADRRLLPLLRADETPTRRDLEPWCRHLVAECREQLSVVLPLKAAEMEFLDLLNDHGEIAPDRLTDETLLQERIRSHPALLWKALNVRQHRGLGGSGRSRPGPSTVISIRSS
ncbi:MAG: nucleotidyl transferase AbiEii/AbiGii toxin family protein [Acidobacteriota bacterium]